MNTWNPSWMHLYPQSMYHAPAFIVGNRRAFELLRDALTEALDGDGIGAMKQWAVPADGESYPVVAVIRDTVEDLPVPYLADAQDQEFLNGKNISINDLMVSVDRIRDLMYRINREPR